jgi:pilus assembly protein FimV
LVPAPSRRLAEESAPFLRTQRWVRFVISGDALKRKLTLPGRFALTGIAAALCLASPLASALGLGRLNVQSSLGEVLRAEIEVTSLTPEEQASLRIRVAPPEAYRAANVDYNPVLPGTRATFEKRPDGRLFVRLVSDRGVQEPFVDVILEISWATGRLVREYTLLFDPPATIRAGAQQPGATTSPVMSAAPPAPTPLPQTTAMTKAEQREAARAAERERRAQQKAAAAEAKANREESASAAPRSSATTTAATDAAGSGASEDEVKVRSGDTLSKIAGRVQKQGVSLDQMLVALFRANPSAFSGNNMNRLRAGVVLSVPSAETAQAVQPAEARKTIVAQSADFGAYRQRLAEATQASGAEATEPNKRRSAGKVQTSVEDKKLAANASPDTLKLSKGGAIAPSAPGSAEDRLAGERQRQAEAARLAEINRNMTDLRRVAGGASQVAVTPPKPTTAAATTPPAAVAPPTVAVDRVFAGRGPDPDRDADGTAAHGTASARHRSDDAAGDDGCHDASFACAGARRASCRDRIVVAPATTMAAASTPPAMASGAAPVVVAGASATQPAAVKPPTAKPRTPAKPAPEPSFIDSITSGNPIYLGVGALALLLVGYGAYRYTQRSKKDSGETSFLESRLQPDSFFGASGGQRIDTRDAGGSSSSMTYSLSQLDAIGDVDPVAEADVYLAVRPRPAGRGDPQGGDAQQSRAPRDPHQAARGLRQAARHQGLRAPRDAAVRADARRGRRLVEGAGARRPDRSRESALSGRRHARPLRRRRCRGGRVARREHAAAVGDAGAVAVRLDDRQHHGARQRVRQHRPRSRQPRHRRAVAPGCARRDPCDAAAAGRRRGPELQLDAEDAARRQRAWPAGGGARFPRRAAAVRPVGNLARPRSV